MAPTALLLALPELRAAYDALQVLANAEGIFFRVAPFGGVRSYADTVKIMQYRDADWAVAVRKDPSLARRTTKEKWRPIAPFGTSMHNHGAAFDMDVYRQPPGMSYSAVSDRLHALGLRVGLTSGRAYNDPRHMQLTRYTVAQASQRYAVYRATLNRKVVAPAAVTLAAIVLVAVFG